eukprot:g11428.t1
MHRHFCRACDFNGTCAWSTELAESRPANLNTAAVEAEHQEDHGPPYLLNEDQARGPNVETNHSLPLLNIAVALQGADIDPSYWTEMEKRRLEFKYEHFVAHKNKKPGSGSGMKRNSTATTMTGTRTTSDVVVPDHFKAFDSFRIYRSSSTSPADLSTTTHTLITPSKVLSQFAGRICYHCWAAAITAAFADRIRIATRGLLAPTIAMQSFLNWDPTISGGDCRNGMAYAGLKFLKNYAAAEESNAPYRGYGFSWGIECCAKMGGYDSPGALGNRVLFQDEPEEQTEATGEEDWFDKYEAGVLLPAGVVLEREEEKNANFHGGGRSKSYLLRRNKVLGKLRQAVGENRTTFDEERKRIRSKRDFVCKHMSSYSCNWGGDCGFLAHGSHESGYVVSSTDEDGSVEADDDPAELYFQTGGKSKFVFENPCDGYPNVYRISDFAPLLPVTEFSMMREIYAGGPIACGFFSNTKSVDRYRATKPPVLVPDEHSAKISTEAESDHFVEVTGWGTSATTNGKGTTTSSDSEHWVVRNSWGTSWGYAGWFQIQKGSNLLNMESTFCLHMVPSRANLEAQLNRQHPKDPFTAALHATPFHNAHAWTFDCTCYHEQKSVYGDFLRYYRFRIPPLRLVVDLGNLFSEPNLSENKCAAATLSALLLKVEETMYYDRAGALRVFDRYAVEFAKALEENRLSVDEAEKVWYLVERFRLVKSVLFLKKRKQDEVERPEEIQKGHEVEAAAGGTKTVDLALSFCKEDLSWLETVLDPERFWGLNVPQAAAPPEARAEADEQEDHRIRALSSPRIRIFLYRKCLYRDISRENENVIRRVNAVLLGDDRYKDSAFRGHESSDAGDYRILHDIPQPQDTDYGIENSNVVKESSNVYNFGVALQRNKNQDIMDVAGATSSSPSSGAPSTTEISEERGQLSGSSVVDDPPPKNEDDADWRIRWQRYEHQDLFVGVGTSTASIWNAHAEDFQFARFGVFHVIDVVEDIRSDECSAYLTHMMLMSSTVSSTSARAGGQHARRESDFADATFFLHADANNHVLPSVMLVGQLLEAMLLEKTWGFSFGGGAGTRKHEPSFRIADEQWTAVEEYYQHNGGAASDAKVFHGDHGEVAVIHDPDQDEEEDAAARSGTKNDYSSGFLPVLYLTQNFIRYTDSERLLESGYWQQFYKQLFHTSIPLDEDELQLYCCAHFVAPREALERRDFGFYEKLWTFMTGYESFTDMLGVAGDATTLSRSITTTPAPAEAAQLDLFYSQKEHAGRVSLRQEKARAIMPVATWYDRVCRYPCQHLMLFWHVMLGDTVKQKKRGAGREANHWEGKEDEDQ